MWSAKSLRRRAPSCARSHPSAPREAYRATRERTGGHGSVRHSAVSTSRGDAPVPINWRRGLLRVWMVLSAGWVMGWAISHHRWAAGRPADQSSLGGHTSCAVGTAHRAAAVWTRSGWPSEGSTSITGCGGNRAATRLTHASYASGPNPRESASSFCVGSLAPTFGPFVEQNCTR